MPAQREAAPRHAPPTATTGTRLAGSLVQDYSSHQHSEDALGAQRAQGSQVPQGEPGDWAQGTHLLAMKP